MSFKDILDALRQIESSPSRGGVELRVSFSKLVIRKLRELGWTQKRLADECNKKEPYISRVINGDQNWSSDIAGQILFALKTRAEFVENEPVCEFANPRWATSAEELGVRFVTDRTDAKEKPEEYLAASGEAKTLSFRTGNSDLGTPPLSRLKPQEHLD